MIIFEDMLKMLADHGWSTYKLQKEKKIANGTIIQIRAKKPLTTTTINTICELCDCQPGDLMRYIPDKQEE